MRGHHGHLRGGGRRLSVDPVGGSQAVLVDVHAFEQVLRQAGVNVHIRASRGRDIAAACGQLRHETQAAGAKA